MLTRSLNDKNSEDPLSQRRRPGSVQRRLPAEPRVPLAAPGATRAAATEALAVPEEWGAQFHQEGKADFSVSQTGHSPS